MRNLLTKINQPSYNADTEHPYRLFRPAQGLSRVRILIPKPAAAHVHFVKARDGSWRRFTCAGRGACCLCRADMRPKFMWALIVLDRSDWQVKIWGVTQYTIREQLSHICRTCGDWTGVDIVITRAGEGLQTTYRVDPVEDSAPLSPEEKALPLPNLDEHLRVETPDEIHQRLTEGNGGNKHGV